MKRGSARQRGYTARWDRAARRYKQEHPLCRMCMEQGHIVPTYAVDHIIPHKGDMALFWDEANWQPLCRTHHNATKQSEERLGYVKGVDVSGAPLDEQHPWNR